MRRLTFLLLTAAIVGSMCSAIGTSGSNNMSAVSRPPISTASDQAQQDAPGVIKGADDPDSIPDHMAFSVIFRLLSNAQTDVEKHRARAYLRRLGLGVQACKDAPTAASPEARERDIDAFLTAASELKQQVSLLDERARDIRTLNRSTMTSAVTARLTKLQRQKEVMVWRVVASLPRRLTSDGITLLRQRVREYVKKNIKITPKGDTTLVSSLDSQAHKSMGEGLDTENKFQVHIEPPTNTEPRRQDSILRRRSVLGLATTPAAFSRRQREDMLDEPPPSECCGTYSYVDYTDQWTDNSNPEVPIVMGNGVTETSYDSFGDLSVIEGTFTDPNGNTASASGHGDLYASVTIGLPYYWDFTNDGDWVFDGLISRYCRNGTYYVPYPSYYLDGFYYAPCYGYPFQQRRVIRRRRRTFVIHSYRRENGEYVPTCDSNCTYYPRWIPIGVTAPFIECNTVYTYGEGCADAYLCKDKTTPGKCTPPFIDPF